jgi:hypothetical protein
MFLTVQKTIHYQEFYETLIEYPYKLLVWIDGCVQNINALIA